MIVSTRPLIDLVPVQPAAMAGRQICQWDKDSCADAGFLKIDLLGLGMLSAVEEAVDLIARLHREPIDLSRIPLDDPEVYAEIQAADTVGVFQIESRAQMQSLLRTQTGEPRRPDRAGRARPPGPDPGQGRAPVHREPAPPARGPDASCRRSSTSRCASRSQDTLGVVVFQDQVLDVAMASRRVQRGGGRRAAARDEPQAQRGGDRGVPAALRRRLPR